MKWLDRLLGRSVTDAEDVADTHALHDLHRKWDRVQKPRVERLERELQRVNAELRRGLQPR